MKLVAIDFETANRYSCSACSLGYVVYEEGEFLDRGSFLIRPSSKYNFFTNTFIHHITPEDVKGEAEFIDRYDFIRNLLEGNVVLAHNACFDVSVLNACCDCYGLDHIPFSYLDTVTLSRRVNPELYHHNLNVVSEYLGIDLDHHEAGSDSFACLMIVIKAMEKYGLYDLNDLLAHVHVNLRENH